MDTTKDSIFSAAGEEAKRHALRRMQGVASALLIVMVLALSIATIGEAAHPWLAWLRAFAEAAVVGAIADWFAVVALFRHPLGLPIPHTAIVPRSKDRIGDALGRFVEDNFLTPQNVMRRLAGVNLALVGARWLEKPANSERAAHGICSLVPRFLAMIEDEQVAAFLTRTLLGEFEKVNLSQLAGEMLDVVTSAKQYDALFEDILGGIERLVVANEELILDKFGEASKYTPGILDAYIVGRFVEGMVALLREVRQNREHPLRTQMTNATFDLIRLLKTSPAYFERGVEFKYQIIDHLKTKPYYRALWHDVKRRILGDVASDDSWLRRTIASMLVAIGRGLRLDGSMQTRINHWSLQTLERLMLTHRHQISLLITDVVRGWDAEQVGKKIELEIGKDLQYIRLNGTIVGGCVGIVLHAAAVLFV